MSQFALFDAEPTPASPAGPLPSSPVPAAPGFVKLGELTPAEKAERLDMLRAPALACEKCGLSTSRTHVVFGEGNPASPLVLIGEGPGENEDATGRPFVGRAGKLLDEVLYRAGMGRQHVYICNVLKCRATVLENGRRANRPPTQEEMAACLPWLQQQLGIIQPLVILCLGAPAANTIIKKGFKMTAERGKWFTTSSYAPWAMAAFHPAYVLRQHGPTYDRDVETLVQDLAAARQKVIEVKREQRARAGGPP
ncbi:MAG: uracil-DNA glycosylase [Armatimonadetes bacterium]|nr:uracil-DNA glycosylase [Armatimonadota bacterium]